MTFRVLIVSNLDSKQPFGQFTRPFFLGRGMARLGIEVGNVAPDCSRVDFGPVWSTGTQGLRALRAATMTALGTFRPDVIYAHQNMPAVAAILARGSAPIAADSHALASEEWRLRAQGQPPAETLVCRLRQAKAYTAERLISKRASLIVAAAEELGAMLAQMHGARRLATVLNGVDDRMLESPTTSAPDAYRTPGPHVVATLPIASSTANERALRFLRQATIELRKLLPTAEVHVLGTEEGEAPGTGGMRFHGMQDVLPWVDNADVCVMPYPQEAVVLGGVRNKLLEYLSRGRTLVTTEEGLMGFTECRDWEGVSVAPDEPTGFARAVSAAAGGDAPTLEAHRDFTREHLSWNRHARHLIDVLEPLAADKRF